MNNQTTKVSSTLLKNKLGRTAIRLQRNANPLGNGSDGVKDFDTLESVVSESVKILNDFYKRLSEPEFKATKLKADAVPSYIDYNNDFTAISDDLTTIFNEFENLEEVVVGDFNYMVSRLNRLNRTLKSVSSSLGDFVLFSNLPIKDSIYFSDSFNNLDRVEVNSPLINTEQAEVNQVEGIVTLPIDRQAQVALNVTEIPVINSNSNGVAGNNQEVGAQSRTNISDILDNNADTWFEYERVVQEDDGEALVLDFTINIGNPQVINFIRINPNNFGTKTQIEIVTIETSVDGKAFVNVKDDIPIADFTTQDEENVFKLAPSTSKYAGQGLYTFTPRKAKYVHIVLKQTTPYIISTSTTQQKLRYAIGIRDVHIEALPYKSQGEVISSEYSVTDDIRKIVLLSNQNPTAGTVSSLAEIEHYVSPDNGLSWYQIRPKASAGIVAQQQEIPELLDFNGVSENTVKTDNPVRSVRYKAVLSRNTDAFNDESPELAQETAYGTELHSPPTTTPFEIILQRQPVDDTLNLIWPKFGSRGKKDNKYTVAIGTGQKLSIFLPFRPLARSFEKDLSGSFPSLTDKDPESIFVDGVQWERNNLTGSNNYYKLNYETGLLEFGDGTNGNAVSVGSQVSMILDEENLFPSRGDHIATLDYPTSNDKKQIEIYLEKPITSTTAILKKGSVRNQLKPLVQTNTSPYEIKFSDTAVFSSEQTFIDGSSELTSPGHWSLDYENGTLFSYSTVSDSLETSVNYFYLPRTQLENDHWDFVDSEDGITNTLKIKDDYFQTFQADPFTVPSGVTYFNLPHIGVVEGSVEFSEGSTVPSGLSNQVEFVDGRTELLGVLPLKEELDPITGVSSEVNLSISFNVKITSDTSFATTFSNQTIFRNQVASEGSVSNVGDYWVDRTYTTSPTGRVVVRVDENNSLPGTVTYYYKEPQIETAGRYSIKLDTGEVFTHDIITPTSSGSITADYEYTNYKVRYDIARLVSREDWSYDPNEKKILIEDNEILKSQRTPQTAAQDNSSDYYQATYKYIKQSRDESALLEPFFSPILKDYALKVITKSRLV